MKFKIKNIIFVVIILFALPQFAAQGKEVIVRGEKITIPTPKGYQEVGPEVKGYYEYYKSLADVDKVSDYLVVYMPIDIVQKHIRGEHVHSDRVIYVKMLKQFQKISMTVSDFANVQSLYTIAIERKFEMVRPDIKNQVKRLNDGLSEKFSIDYELKVNEQIPILPHLQTPLVFASTSIYKREEIVNGKKSISNISETATTVLINGTIFNMFVAGSVEDIFFTRTFSMSWMGEFQSVNK
jgi:hypothetical protein